MQLNMWNPIVALKYDVAILTIRVPTWKGKYIDTRKSVNTRDYCPVSKLKLIAYLIWEDCLSKHWTLLLQLWRAKSFIFIGKNENNPIILYVKSSLNVNWKLLNVQFIIFFYLEHCAKYTSNKIFSVISFQSRRKWFTQVKSPNVILEQFHSTS